MPRFDRDDAPGLLAAVGSEFWNVDGADIDDTDIARRLPAGEGDVRALVDIDPPVSGEEDSGMGAWHVNARDELHHVRSGSGVLQVMTPGGVVTVWLEPGDVMAMSGAEHRFRALTPQQWALRWSGPPDADLGARETGRASEAWPGAGT